MCAFAVANGYTRSGIFARTAFCKHERLENARFHHASASDQRKR